MPRTRANDEAVSPVIAVILMVAITVVLAAVVYVWVSGFQVGNTPPGSMSIAFNGHPGASNVSYIVTSATSGMHYTDVALQLDGATLQYANLTAGAPTADKWCLWNPAGYCNASPGSATLNAGDVLYLQNTSPGIGSALNIVDTKANAVLLTITVR